MTTPPSTDDPPALTVTDAYVSASSGVAVGDSTTTAPDQVYVEFSAPVVLDGADGGPRPADGFRLDGATAGIETVRLGTTGTEAAEDGPGSRVLVLSLSRALTADERVTLSYAPAAGDVRLPDGPAPRPVDGFEVRLGSPRIVDAAIPVDYADELRLTFDRAVVSRTGDASQFELLGDNGNRTLAGDIEVDGRHATLPLTGDLTPETVDADGELTIRYRGSGSDTEQPRNLAGEAGALVQPFTQPVTLEVSRDGFGIAEASVPLEPNSSGNVDRSRLALQFDPPVTAESAAGYELRNGLAKVQGLDPAGTGGGAPDVMLDLDAPVDTSEGDQPTVRYDPATGDTRAAGNEVPAEPLSAPVETGGSTPEPLSATLMESGDAIAVEFPRRVNSQSNDTTGLTLSGAGDVELTGAISEGETVTLELSDPLDFRETSNTVKLRYSTQSDSGRRLNLVGAEAGIPVETFKTEVDRHGDGATVKQARIPQERRDAVFVRFDRPVRADTAAGFSLGGTAARVEALASADDLDDSLVPYTLVLGLHTEAQTGSATLAYDGAVGNLDTQQGAPVDSFEQPVDVLPPAPVAQEAFARPGESAVRVRYDRAVTLNQRDDTGFSLSYGVDRDDLPRLTGTVRADGDTVVLQTDGTVAPSANPVLTYQPATAPNVLGVDDGVEAAAERLYVDSAGDPVDGADASDAAESDVADEDVPDAADTEDADADDEDAADLQPGDEDADDGADAPDTDGEAETRAADSGNEDRADPEDGDDRADGPDEQAPAGEEPAVPEEGSVSDEDSDATGDEQSGRIVSASILESRPDRIICEVEGDVEADGDSFALDEVVADISAVVELGEGRIGLQLGEELDDDDQPVVLYEPSD